MKRIPSIISTLCSIPGIFIWLAFIMVLFGNGGMLVMLLRYFSLQQLGFAAVVFPAAAFIASSFGLLLKDRSWLNKGIFILNLIKVTIIFWLYVIAYLITGSAILISDLIQ